MNIEQLREQRGREYVDSMYYIGREGLNWWGRIFKMDGEPWQFEYRWAYSDNDQPFNPQDRKSWHRFTAPDDSQAQLDKCRKHLRAGFPLLEQEFPGETVDVIELQCYATDAKYFIEQASRPWCHIRTGAEALKTVQEFANYDSVVSRGDTPPGASGSFINPTPETSL